MSGEEKTGWAVFSFFVLTFLLLFFGARVDANNRHEIAMAQIKCDVIEQTGGDDE